MRHDQRMDEQFRARFDAVVTFSNGGGITADSFRVDLPSRETSHKEIGALFVASLGLLMTEKVVLTNLEIFAEPHKGTRGGPSAVTAAPSQWSFVELSHPIEHGLVTYPGLPVPEITPHLSRKDSRTHYAEGTEFAIDRITLVGNTGTYLDSPFHRYDGGTDLAGLPLSSLVDLPAVVIRTSSRSVDIGQVAGHHVRGCAVLLHTGGDANWATPAYAHDAPYLTAAAAEWLASNGAVLVGIDSLNIDDIGGGDRPAHSTLLAAGIPIVEHLTGLSALPPTGARFTAAPPMIVGTGTFPVRAYAAIAREDFID
jgi:arylformamidase